MADRESSFQEEELFVNFCWARAEEIQDPEMLGRVEPLRIELPFEPKPTTVEELVAKLQTFGPEIKRKVNQNQEVYLQFLRKVKEYYNLFDPDTSPLDEGDWMRAITAVLPDTHVWNMEYSRHSYMFFTDHTLDYVRDLEMFASLKFHVAGRGIRNCDQLMKEFQVMGKRINPKVNQRAQLYLNFLYEVQRYFREFDHSQTHLDEDDWMCTLIAVLPSTPVWVNEIADLGRQGYIETMEQLLEKLIAFVRRCEEFP